MKNIIKFILLFIVVGSYAQNPAYFKNGYRLNPLSSPPSTPIVSEVYYDLEDQKYYYWDSTEWKEMGDSGVLPDIVPRDSLIVQSPSSFGNIYNYWEGTEAQMDALILIDPNYFDNVLWFCTDCTEVVEVDWGNINGTLSNQTDLQNAFDLKLDVSELSGLAKLGTATGNDDFLLLNRSNANNPPLYVNQYGNGDIARFYKGAGIGEVNGAVGITISNTGALVSTSRAEFGGTVSGADPVNNDDFVTKGYLEGSGSFTATLTDEGGGATYSIGSNSGNYYTVGRFVFFQISLQSISTTGTPTGDLQLSGLPFDSITGFGAKVYRFTGSSVDFYSITGSYSSSGSGGTQRMEFIIQTSSDGNFSTVLTDCTMTSGSIFVSGVFIKTL